MAVLHGKAGAVKIGGNTASSVSSWTMSDGGPELHDNTPLQNTWKTFIAGQRRVTGSIQCDWDQADSNVQGAMLTAALNGSTVTLLLYTTDTNYFTVPAYINVGAEVNIKGIIKRNFRFQSHGTVSFT